jgi:hypothetical protein
VSGAVPVQDRDWVVSKQLEDGHQFKGGNQLENRVRIHDSPLGSTRPARLLQVLRSQHFPLAICGKLRPLHCGQYDRAYRPVQVHAMDRFVGRRTTPITCISCGPLSRASLNILIIRDDRYTPQAEHPGSTRGKVEFSYILLASFHGCRCLALITAICSIASHFFPFLRLHTLSCTPSYGH